MSEASVSKKVALLNAMAPHVMEHGLAAASLRPLAKAAGTSDRMLIYHFGSKDGLIEALLEHIAHGLAASMSQALPPHRAANMKACAQEVMTLIRTPQMRGFMRVWFDIAAAASGDPETENPHRKTGAGILRMFHAWLMTRLPENTAEPEQAASALLTLIEGAVVMEAFGQTQTADAVLSLLEDQL